MIINDAPGYFTQPVFESGSKILSLVKYPQKTHTDLTRNFLTFEISLMILFVFINFVLILIQPFIIYNFKIDFLQSAFLLYKLIFRECNLKSNQIKLHPIFLIMVVYYFLIMSIIEQNNNSKLVVSEQVEYYENLNDIFRLKYVTPHFLKNNYVTGLSI